MVRRRLKSRPDLDRRTAGRGGEHLGDLGIAQGGATCSPVAAQHGAGGQGVRLAVDEDVAARIVAARRRPGAVLRAGIVEAERQVIAA